MIMSVRLFSALVLAVCGTLTGMELRRRASVRIKSLIFFREIFAEVRCMIAYNGLSLRDVALELAHRHSQNQFTTLLYENSAHVSFREAWNAAVESMQKELCLNEDDVLMLSETAAKMGKSDIDGEVGLLDEAGAALGRVIEQAESKLAENGKIYTAVGSSCGIILALLVI